MILDQLDELKRQLKRGFEKELVVNPDGQVMHDSCISHCLLFAFGECNNKHKMQYLKCNHLFNFFDFMAKNISENHQSQLTKAKERLIYYLSHQARKVFLN